jgi:hypothetical protein
MEISMELPEKKIELPYDLAIPLLGIYPKECQSALMFTAALFTIVK